MGNYLPSNQIYKYNPIRLLLPSTYRSIPVKQAPQIFLVEGPKGVKRPPASLKPSTKPTLAYKIYKYKKCLRKRDEIDPVEMMIYKMLLTNSLAEDFKKRRTMNVLIKLLCIRVANYLKTYITTESIEGNNENDEKADENDEFTDIDKEN